MKTGRDVLGSHSSACLQHRSLISPTAAVFFVLPLKGEVGNISGRTERQGGSTHQILLSTFLLPEVQCVKVPEA